MLPSRGNRLNSFQLDPGHPPDDPADATRLAKLNTKATQLRAQAIELLKIPGEEPSKLHFNCAFVSIPQLLAVLRNAHSNDELQRELWETRHMTFSSLDFYFDYAQMKKIKASASPASRVPPERLT